MLLMVLLLVISATTSRTMAGPTAICLTTGPYVRRVASDRIVSWTAIYKNKFPIVDNPRNTRSEKRMCFSTISMKRRGTEIDFRVCSYTNLLVNSPTQNTCSHITLSSTTNFLKSSKHREKIIFYTYAFRSRCQCRPIDDEHVDRLQLNCKIFLRNIGCYLC